MGDDNKPSLFEAHAQSIVAAVTLAVLIGSGTLLVAMRDDITSLKVTVTHMSETLKTAGDDRFRGADWRREKVVLDERYIELRARITDLEKRLTDHERFLPKAAAAAR